MHLKFSVILLVLATPIFYANQESALSKLEKYRSHLEQGTYQSQNWSKFKELPKSRFYTFAKAFEHFEKNNGKIVVELGTTHSFVDGQFPGCDSNDVKYWRPNNPEFWDWGAGCFTLMACECLAHLNPEIHTIDLYSSAIQRCKVMTRSYQGIITHHVTSSEAFLENFPHKIDLLYLDTGYMNPIEPTAQLQLREVKIIVERDLLSENGLLLIDDVRNQSAIGDISGLGKSKYSIPYLLKNGFEFVEDEYQVIMRKKKQSPNT